ncbi:MAG: hypothetical protein PGN19_02055 [Pseudomonas oryzihabitans]
MEETTLATASRHAADPASDTPAAATAATSEAESVPALARAGVPSTSIKLPALDGPLEGIEITRLPWGYAVTRTPRTP